ncbi:unnamed protein product [Pleuronectes platessa]|uniref:Uncharacterized protein n=1 Tax=Pleuronectes platessa TaxID=8262 RepID=A0A9N7Z111_PLEPL|nr:unnamed protein product [Pleuronectes platessa]
MTSHPTNHLHTPRIPHPLPLSPPLLFCGLRPIEAPCSPSPIGARLHFMADCEACVSPSSASVPPPISSGSPTCSLHSRSCQKRLPPSPDLPKVETPSDSVNRKAVCSPLHHIDGERSELSFGEEFVHSCQVVVHWASVEALRSSAS